jgi:hypothetical protein
MPEMFTERERRQLRGAGVSCCLLFGQLHDSPKGKHLREELRSATGSWLTGSVKGMILLVNPHEKTMETSAPRLGDWDGGMC